MVRTDRTNLEGTLLQRIQGRVAQISEQLTERGQPFLVQVCGWFGRLDLFEGIHIVLFGHPENLLCFESVFRTIRLTDFNTTTL